MSISDRIAVMYRGRVEQFGTPEEIYASPATRYVATFIGSPQIDLFPGVIEREGDKTFCRLGITRLPLPPGSASAVAHGTEVEVGIRAEHVSLCDSGIPARVRLVQPVGPSTHTTLEWEGGRLTARLNGFARIEPGRQVHLALDAAHLLLFDRETGLRLSAQ